MLETWSFVSVIPGRDARNRIDDETRGRGHEPKLTRGEARRPQVELLLGSARVSQRCPLVVHPRRGIEPVAALEEAHRERDVEGAQCEPSTRSQRRGEAGEQTLVFAAAEQTEATLTQADDGIEVTALVELAHVGNAELHAQLFVVGGLTREVDELLGVVDTDDVHPAPSQREGVTSRSAAHVEHTRARTQSEPLEQERDLLLGSVRERVAEVRGPEEPRELVEPVVVRRERHIGHRPRLRGQCVTKVRP